MKIVALILFGLTYILLLSLPKHRAYVALCSAAIFVILGIVPFKEVLSAIDWNVIMMIAGTMGIVSLFTESKMPNLLADMLIEKTATVKWAIIALSLFAGIISAFIDNVATVLMIAPVALDHCEQTGHFTCIKHHRNIDCIQSARCGDFSGRYHFHLARQACRHELHGFLCLPRQNGIVLGGSAWGVGFYRDFACGFPQGKAEGPRHGTDQGHKLFPKHPLGGNGTAFNHRIIYPQHP